MVIASTSKTRIYQVALGAIALVALGLRIFPFFGPDGALGYQFDYDEGVYYSAASYLVRGVFPWRDFVFVHPPGMLLFLAATSGWSQSFLGIAGAFALSRWVAALCGVISTLLVARIVSSAEGSPPWAGLLAAAFYATYPELVTVERGPFLEPVLNLVCLTLVLVVATASTSPNRARLLLVAGGLGGLAIAIKAWAVIWIVGALWAVGSFASRRDLFRAALAGLLVGSVLIVPFAALAPDAFFTQVARFHLWRPPDGLISRGARAGEIVSIRHLASPLLALLAVGLLTFRRQWTPLARLTVCAWVLTIVAFFASAAWWDQYNAHLIASEAVVAGGLFSLVPPRVRAVFALLSLVSLGYSIVHSIRRTLPVNTEHLAVARSSLHDTADCLFTFEPATSLAAGRLPPLETGPLIDNYAQQLLTAVQGGKRFGNAGEAWASSDVIPPGLLGCRYVLVGARGAAEISLKTFGATHAPVVVDGLELWERIR